MIMKVLQNTLSPSVCENSNELHNLRLNIQRNFDYLSCNDPKLFKFQITYEESLYNNITKTLSEFFSTMEKKKKNFLKYINCHNAQICASRIFYGFHWLYLLVFTLLFISLSLKKNCNCNTCHFHNYNFLKTGGYIWYLLKTASMNNSSTNYFFEN